MERLYFDANATTPIHPEVYKKMEPFLQEEFGNPSSIHYWGQRARNALEEARFQVAKFLHCSPLEVVFTGSGTEANNLAILGLVSRLAEQRESSLKNLRGHCVVSALEHSSVLDPFKWLEGWGIEVTYVAADASGRVDPERIIASIREETFLVSLMLVNNETGVIQSVPEVGRVTRERRIPFHVDAIQAAGKLPVVPEDLEADLLTLAPHKAEGPKGVGVLFIRRGCKLSPLIRGGSLDGGLRGGTHNVPAIVGCGATFARLDEEYLERVREKASLRDRFERALEERLSVEVNGKGAGRVWNTSNVSFPGVASDVLLVRLDQAGLAASRGSACAAGSTKPSHVLLSMGLDRSRVLSSIRFSFLPSITEREVDLAVDMIEECVKDLRK
ncbi:MAG: cysteine desulfurase [Spirochaetes bacterium]|nr:cysteine desulfurase [Spirochaetota bacterium]